jgi:two-component sensor histidine kinase
MQLSRQRVRDQLQALVGSHGVVYSVAEAFVDQNMLRLLAHEAFSNAVKYAAPGTPIIVAARLASGAQRPTSSASERGWLGRSSGGWEGGC